jgi:hypothetical protein
MINIDKVTTSFNAVRTGVVEAQRVRESKKGKKTSWARQTEVEKEHEPRVNPVLETRLDSSEAVSHNLPPRNLPPRGKYNSKGEFTEDYDNRKPTDIKA